MNKKGSKFSISFDKSRELDIDGLYNNYVQTEEEALYKYNPFMMKNTQSYIPIYNTLLSLDESNYNSLSLKCHYDFLDMEHVCSTEKGASNKMSKKVFIKFSPLLDPIRYMTGKYDVSDNIIRTLPSINESGFPKLENIHNASYVDGFFSFLSSQLLHNHNVPNALDYYGSYLTLQDKYKMNITDDLEYLYGSPFFMSHLNDLYSLSNQNGSLEGFINYNSRANKQKLQIKDTAKNISYSVISDLGIEELPVLEEITIVNPSTEELVYEKFANGSPNSSKSKISNSSCSSSDTSEVNYSSDEDNNEEHSILETESNGENEDDEESDKESSQYETEDEEGSDESEEENENIVNVYVNNYPVQMICLEKCDGTLDQLFVREVIDEAIGSSALMQIVMTLIIYQEAFHFTHNDLHTNNIMYVKTDEEYLFYEYKGKRYRVPTYGYIFKIIDFGRGIYKLNGKTYCSDSFAEGGDAYSQYNFEPFINNSKPRLDPNYSFDLCRLGCSIYDFAIDDGDEPRDMDDFQKTIYRWCLDDNNKNVLYKKNGEERYPNFKLYKMIARTVHNHTPQEQLKYPIFSQYVISEKQWIKHGKPETINLDKIPCYV